MAGPLHRLGALDGLGGRTVSQHCRIANVCGTYPDAGAQCRAEVGTTSILPGRTNVADVTTRRQHQILGCLSTPGCSPRTGMPWAEVRTAARWHGVPRVAYWPAPTRG